MEINEAKMTEFMEILAVNIKKLRKAKGYSQERLAELAGLHPTYVSHLETGKANPTVAILLSLSERLGVNVERLLMPETDFLADETLQKLQKSLDTADSGKKAAVTGILSELDKLI